MKKTLVNDILSGLTVSFAALSLGAAFGIMSGRGALAGMIGAAVIPIITSVFGGTRIQASGPTAPMTAISALIIAYAYEAFPNKQFAEQYISLTILLSSVFIILSGVFKLGRFIKKVPQVVVIGFMNGIALLIWLNQIQKLFGLSGKSQLDGSLYINVGIAFSVLATIYFIPFIFKKAKVPNTITRFLPPIFIAIIGFTLYTTYQGTEVERVSLGVKINSFNEYLYILKSYFPTELSLYSLSTFKTILPFAIQLCLLAYLDSLLTSLVVDKMMKEKTDTNKELLAQGFGNAISGLLQGIPGAQATIRSVLLIKEGAKTRLAGVLVGVFTLLGFLVFSNLITLISSAVFTGVLFKAGLDVMDRDFPYAYLKLKWYKVKMRNIQLLFIVYTTIVTVLFDLNIAVISGTFLFHISKKIFGIIDIKDEVIEEKSSKKVEPKIKLSVAA